MAPLHYLALLIAAAAAAAATAATPAAAPVAAVGEPEALCYTFYSGLCPGPADCMCTDRAACSADPNATLPLLPPPHMINRVGGCNGQCRRVVHNECTGSNSCLKDSGSCSGPSPPPSPGPSPPPSPGPSPPPASAPIGPDVSDYQGDVNWAEVKAAGAGFGIAKATEGLTVSDKQFASNWKGMRAAGVKVRGAYHFAHPSESATEQATHFLGQVGSIGHGEFAVLDIEDATTKLAANYSIAAENAVATWCVDFVQAVTSKAGISKHKMWIYTGAWFWNPKAGGSSALASYPLWVSAYSATPPLPSGWLTYTMWQYTDSGSFRGIGGKCDVSRFKGSQLELELLVG